MRSLTKLFLAIPLLFWSCEEPYAPDYEPDDSTPILIIDGFIDMSGNSRFKLSYTVPLNVEESTRPARGATLAIESENNESYTSSFSTEAGSYTVSHPALSMNTRYRLRAVISGKEYLSDWVTPYATSEISEIDYKRTDLGMEIYVSSVNSDENARYYRWECEETWKFSARYRSSFIYDPFSGSVRYRTPEENISVCFQHENSAEILVGTTENLSNNTVSRQMVRFIPNLSDKLMIRYSILVKQFNISKEAYLFWSILRKNSESVGDIFGSMPSELKGNVRNIANPSEPVIAMIEASLPTQKRIYYDAFDFPDPWVVSIPFYSGCEAQEVSVAGAPALFAGTPAYIPIYELFRNEASPFPTHYAFTTRRCTDCSLIGSLNQPDFWTDLD